MPSKIKIEIRAQLHDSQGRLIKTFPWRKANSLLKGFAQMLACSMSQTSQTIKNTAGGDSAITIDQYLLRVNGPAANVAMGLLIGTGTTAVTMLDFKLQTQVSANVAHGAVTFAVENPDASTWRLAISRIFTNSTGASLGIREAALYYQNAGVSVWICLDRTLYSVDVPNGVAVTLTYRITVSL